MEPNGRPGALRVNRSVLASLDRAFAAALAGSLFVHCSFVLAINQRKGTPQENPEVEVIPFHAWRPHLPAPASPQPSPSASSGKPGRPARTNRPSMSAEVERALRWIGADAEGRGSAIEDAMAPGGESKSIEQALQGAHGNIRVALEPATRRDIEREVGRIEDPTTRGRGSSVLDEEGVGRHGVRGGVTPEEPPLEPAGCNASLVKSVVKRNLRGLSMCYERELTRQPSLRGKLVVRIEIASNGHVESVDVEEDSLGSDAVARCVRQIIRFWAFPPPGQDCPVSYPFLFQPLN